MSKVLPYTVICKINGNAEVYLNALSGLQTTANDEVQLILVLTAEQSVSFDTLSSSFSEIKQLHLSSSYSDALLYDRALAAANKAYLVFIQEPHTINKSFITSCLEEVARSAVKIRTAHENRIIFAEREYLIDHGMSAAIIDSKSLEPVQERPLPSLKKNSGVFKDLFNRPVTLEYGAGSFVDPDVVVDSPEKIYIGSNTMIRKGVVLRPEGGEIVIGNNCVINHYCIMHGKGGIYIGDWSIIAPHCGFYAQNHSFDRFDIPITKQLNSGKGIYLMGDNWIGSHSVICDDVTLGKGVVIGANSTVTRSMPMAVVAVGSPAGIIKNRFGENWDFHQRERASTEGMPEDIIRYVQERGMVLCGFIETNDVVLDLGCGEGIITAQIAKKAVDTTGCDYCDSSVSDAKKMFPGVKFVQSNVTSLNFKDNHFSKVTFTEVAEHLLPVQLEDALEEIARVLRSDGALLITTPLTGAGQKTSTYAHIYEYSFQEMHALLSVYFNDVKFVNQKFGLFLAMNKRNR